VRYHVQIQRGFRVARAFNLTEEELRARIVRPWSAGLPVALGDRDWDPAEAQISILAGPELDGPQLAMGQGWQSAERSGREVTAQLLRAAQSAVAVLAQTEAAAQATAAALEHLGLQAVPWDRGRTPAQAALIALDPRAGEGDARWWLEVGLALGLLGERALVAVLGGGPAPAPLEGAEAIALDADDPHALAERLRLAGCAV